MNKTIGKKIACRSCNAEAIIILTESRYFVDCLACGEHYLLKEQWTNSRERRKNESLTPQKTFNF